MNRSNQHLLQQLENATSPLSNSDSTTDAETEQMRQGWDYFSILVEEAEERARVGIDVRSEVETWTRQPRSASAFQAWPVALAMGMLVVLTAASIWTIGRDTGVLNAEKSAVPSIDQEGLAHRLSSTHHLNSLQSANNELAWDDTLDQQMGWFQEAIILSNSSVQHTDLVYDLLEWRIHTLGDDIESDSL